jgi:hypothetical protein
MLFERPIYLAILKGAKIKEIVEVKRKKVFTVDLAQVEGDGEISCPKCGTAISPDDDSEGTYSIVEPKVNSHGLKELIIQCNRCASKLHLTGFSLLDKLS